jgi:hypothetical protein
VDLLGFSGSGRLFSTKRLSALERIAEFRKPSYLKLEVLTAEKFSAGRTFTSTTGRSSVKGRIRPGIGDELKFPTIQLIRSTPILLRNG